MQPKMLIRKRLGIATYFFLGLASPLLFWIIWSLIASSLVGLAGVAGLPIISWIDHSILLISLISTGFIFFNFLHPKAFRLYKRIGGKSSTKAIRRQAITWWIATNFLPVCLVIVLSGSNNHSRSNAKVAAVKNGLANGVKECIVRQADNETTRFSGSQSFKGSYIGYEILPISDPKSDGANCFAAVAEPISSYQKQFNWFSISRIIWENKGRNNTYFSITLDPNTGVVTKTCGDSSKPGCNKGNTW